MTCVGVKAGTPVEGFLEELRKVWKVAWNSGRVSDKEDSRKKEHRGMRGGYKMCLGNAPCPL